MSSDLKILLIISVWTGIVAFVFYWRGTARAEAQAKAREAQLIAELDCAVLALGSMLRGAA
jgi:methyl coenzyme M reductase subunit C-like uncharacterized protein (methanogenesis marker protein 7)